MVDKLSALFKFRAFRVTIIFLLLAGAVALAVLFFIPSKTANEVPEPVLNLEYCGAELVDLCVLSFGRDVNADETIVTLFAPHDFPDFYLKIVKANSEASYKCRENKETPGYVFCTGDSVSLKEKVELNILSVNDDRLLAAGDFLVNAILISPQTLQSDSTQTSETPSVDTPTPRKTATSTSTETPQPAYPQPSYP
jgi:hypothetical protein